MKKDIKKTKPVTTEIIIVLDRSGSMISIKEDTIGGFNTFIETQKKLPGKAILTLVQFDNEYEMVHDAIDIKKVPFLTEETYVPRGSTALLDAMGKTISSTSARLSKKRKKPDQVLFVTITDGEENSSKEFTNEKIRELTKNCTDKDKWQFVYIGANQDAFAVGGNMNITTTTNFIATPTGTRAMYASLNTSTSNYRSSANAQVDDFFGQTEKKKLKSKSI